MTRKLQWSLPVMLPIWISFAYLGASFFIDNKKLAERLTVYISLLISAPIFLLALQSSIPSRLTLSQVELQTIALMIAVGAVGASSMFSHNLRVKRKQRNADGASILLSDIVMGLLYWQIFPGLRSHWIPWTWNLIIILFPVLATLAVFKINPLRWTLRILKNRKYAAKSQNGP